MPELFRKQKTLAELEEESDRLEEEDRNLGIELSIKQKRMAIVELGKQGLKPKNFGDPSQPSTWSRIWGFLKGDSLGITKMFKRH